MKTHLLILGFFFILSAAHAQTPRSQGKQDAPTQSGSRVVYLQSSASPLSEDSKPAPKQAITIAPETQSRTVIILGTAQPLDPNAKPAEKKIIVTGTEPVNRESKRESSRAVEEKKD